MLIPYGTDAPIYYWPFATVAMIVANVAAFIAVFVMAATMREDQFLELYSELILLYGHGLRPWQWITSNFLHAGFFHLLGNMFCLWGFGIVVEGKIGWSRFLLIYFGIGITQCAVEQTLMLGASEGASLGASSIIYGLLAIAMVWAPQNEMHCVFLIIVRPITFDITLYTLAMFAAVFELGSGLLFGESMGSQVLHLMGLGLGFGIATVMLKKGWVDCEGWDVFSVWTGRETDKRDQEDASAQELLAEAERKRMAARDIASSGGAASAPSDWDDLQADSPAAEADATQVAEIRAALEQGDAAAAFDAYRTVSRDPLSWPPERELLSIISLFQRKKQWAASIPAMAEYVTRFNDREVAVRLRLARVLLEIERRPRQAIAVLSKIDTSLLSEKDRATFAKLAAKAKQLKGIVSDESKVQDW